MPKLPGGLTKFQRVQAVKEVLSRWGKLNKGQIDQYVAAALGSTAEVLERALYRDLEDLENLNEVVVLRHTRDGKLIENYDPETHRNIYCEWALPNAERDILGGRLFTENHINFYPAKRLAQSFRVKTLSDPLSNGELNFIFKFEQRSYCLALAHEALPAKVALSRSSDGEKVEAALKAFEEVLGKRASCLMLPLPNLSKLKDAERLGHLVIDVLSTNSIILRDLGSKNGTSFVKLSANQADDVIRELAHAAESTFTDDLRLSHQYVKTELPSQASVDLSLPVLIQASRGFEILVI